MKKILFTGSRSGIANAVIKKLINKNYLIYLTVHTEIQLKYIKQKYENISNIICLKLDITNSDDINKIKDLDIDILVCNAAIGNGGSIIDIDINKIKDNFEVNVFSNFELIQLFLKEMIKKENGKIIIMSSLASILPLPFLGSYCASKASISMLTKCLKKEVQLINEDIYISLILPGMYHTGFNQVMLDNKYPLQNNYFDEIIKTIRKKEKVFFNLFEKKNLKTITNKIYRCITSEKPKFIYSAPISQYIFSKIYQFFE